MSEWRDRDRRRIEGADAAELAKIRAEVDECRWAGMLAAVEFMEPLIERRAAELDALAEAYAPGPVLDDLAATVRAGPWRSLAELEGWIADRIEAAGEGRD